MEENAKPYPTKISIINNISVPVHCMNRHGRWAWVEGVLNPSGTISPKVFSSYRDATFRTIEFEMNGIMSWVRMPMNGQPGIMVEIKTTPGP